MSTLKDIFGRAIPDRLARVFGARPRIVALVQEMGRYQAEMRDLARDCPDLKLSNVVDALETVRVLLMKQAPASPCDCHAWEYDCRKCGGKRWVNGGEFLALRNAEPTPALLESSPISPELTIPSHCGIRLAG